MAAKIYRFERPKKKSDWSLGGVPFGKPVAALGGVCFAIDSAIRYAAKHGAPLDHGLDQLMVVIMVLCFTYFAIRKRS